MLLHVFLDSVSVDFRAAIIVKPFRQAANLVLDESK
jgi:hypothetical protein